MLYIDASGSRSDGKMEGSALAAILQDDVTYELGFPQQNIVSGVERPAQGSCSSLQPLITR